MGNLHAGLCMLVGGWGCALFSFCALLRSASHFLGKTEGWQHRFGCFTPVSVPCRGSAHRVGRLPHGASASFWQRLRSSCCGVAVSLWLQHPAQQFEQRACIVSAGYSGLGLQGGSTILTASPMAVVPSLSCKVAVSSWLHYLLHWCLCVVSEHLVHSTPVRPSLAGVP